VDVTLDPHYVEVSGYYKAPAALPRATHGLRSRATERRGQVVNTPASYSEVSVQISARRPAILTEVIRGFPPSLKANSGIAP
jgi:hypothetical protein